MYVFIPFQLTLFILLCSYDGTMAADKQQHVIDMLRRSHDETECTSEGRF